MFVSLRNCDSEMLCYTWLTLKSFHFFLEVFYKFKCIDRKQEIIKTHFKESLNFGNASSFLMIASTKFENYNLFNHSCQRQYLQNRFCSRPVLFQQLNNKTVKNLAQYLLPLKRFSYLKFWPCFKTGALAILGVLLKEKVLFRGVRTFKTT